MMATKLVTSPKQVLIIPPVSVSAKIISQLLLVDRKTKDVLLRQSLKNLWTNVSYSQTMRT